MPDCLKHRVTAHLLICELVNILKKLIRRFQTWKKKSIQVSFLNRGSYNSAHVLLNLLNEFGKRDKMRGLSRTKTKWPPTGFHSTANFSSLQHPETMPRKHVNSGHHRFASETPSEWRFAVGSTVA